MATEPTWVKREHLIATVVVLVIGGGGGGLADVGSISSRLDEQRISSAAAAKEQGEKLDKLVLALTELKGQVTTNKKSATKIDAKLLTIVKQISLIEQKQTTHDVQITE